MSIGIVLNTYKRTNYLVEQVNAIKSQTAKFDRLIVNRNDSWDDSTFAQLEVDWVKSDKNQGVYRRFCIGLDLETDFLLFFDDDTIPGINYLKLLIEEYEKEPGLYSAAGFVLNHKKYSDRVVYGWPNQHITRNKTKVDWPGHSWFMSKDVLLESYAIKRWQSNLCGEDMRLALAAQRLGLNSFVTPYNQDKTIWGSLKGTNGNDDKATFRLPNQKENMHKAMTFYRNLGWKFLSEK